MSATKKTPVKTKLEKGGEEYVQCETLMKEMEELPEAEPFLAPVDWKALNLPDYPKVIKKPMDLGTIAEKLESGGYSNVAAFGSDIRLVWQNAMKFNQPGSGIYVAADNLSKVFEKKFSKITKKPPPPPVGADKKRKRSDAKSNSKSGPVYAEKLRFSQVVNKLSTQQLGKVVEMIHNRCPSALNDEDETYLEIEVDQIDKATLAALNTYADSCLGAGEAQTGAAPPSKKKKSSA